MAYLSTLVSKYLVANHETGKIADVHEFVESLPSVCEKLVGDRGRKLSGQSDLMLVKKKINL